MSQALFSTLQTSCHRSQTELDLETGLREQEGAAGSIISCPVPTRTALPLLLPPAALPGARGRLEALQSLCPWPLHQAEREVLILSK